MLHSCSPPIVILEQPAQSLPNLNTPGFLRRHSADEFIPDALMGALLVVVNYVIGDGPDQRLSSQEDHLIEALRLDRVVFLPLAWASFFRASSMKR